MKKELSRQFQHFWRTFKGIVEDFQEPFWTDGGFALTTPARLAFHIIQSTQYYTGDMEPIQYEPGKSTKTPGKELGNRDLPTKGDIQGLITILSERTDGWIAGLDLEGENTQFPWTGDLIVSVPLFLIRHSQHHLGEMNALLNEQETGNAKDHFARSL